MAAPSPDVPLKHSRAMHVLAGLSFVPVLGLLPGFIGLCWGLVSNRPRSMRAAVIAGAGMLFNFTGCGLLSFWVLSQGEGPHVGRAVLIRADLAILAEQLERAHTQTGRYPEHLTDLRVPPFNLPPRNIPDRGLGWLNRDVPYHYEADPDGQHYRLYSVGLDGRAGTGDDIYATRPDSTQVESGTAQP